jgi:hypothetical protein
MPRSVSVLAILLACATPDFGQRFIETTAKAAEGSSGKGLPNETIGPDNAENVRDLIPITAAGNIRVEGSSVGEQGGLVHRALSGSTRKAVLSERSYPGHTTTSMADDSLKVLGNEAVFSPFLFVGPSRALL